MAVSEICWLESPNQELNPQLPAADVVSHVTAPPPIAKAREFQKSMEDSSTIPKAREFQKSMEDSSLASSICSTLDDIQPPSMMNSLISMSEKPSLPNSPRVSSKFECRHSSNKKLLTNSGHRLVPETVRFGIFFLKLFWPSVRKNCYSDTRETWGWRPRICKNFEIIRTIYSNSERSEEFLKRMGFFFLEIFQI